MVTNKKKEIRRTLDINIAWKLTGNTGWPEEFGRTNFNPVVRTDHTDQSVMLLMMMKPICIFAR
jgi:hypothetical protein